MFLSEVEHKSFCVKFLLVLFANLKSSKNHIKIRKYSTCRLIFGLFLKLKKLWRANEAFRIVLLQRHKKSRCVIIFLSSMQKKKIPAGKCDRYQVGWKWSTRRLVEDGMSTGLTNTHTARGFSDLYHVFARKQCIRCSALRHGCLTLLYVTSIRDFFAHGTTAQSSIRLSSRSLASSRGCSLAIIYNLLLALLSK